MIAKILMCPCFVESFHEEGNSYVKKQYHFICKCKDNQEYFVHTCQYHLCIGKLLYGMQSNCSCKNLGLFLICGFCVQVKYLINFRTDSLCVKSIPEKIAQHFVPSDKYLQDEMRKCGPFF